MKSRVNHRWSGYAAALLMAGIMPGVACAQSAGDGSSVILYGIIDASVNFQHYSGQGAAKSANGTYLSSDTSLFGIKGTENLGGGLSAYFKLENGFNINNGAQTSATAFFNRESYVGLSSTTYGSLQLGSQFAPTVWISGKTDVFARRGTGSIFTLLQNLGSNPRGFPSIYNNAVQYITPSFHGFTGRAMYAFANGGLGSSNAFSVEYNAHKLYAGAYYTRARIAGDAAGLPVSSVSSRSYGLGASYEFSLLTLYGHLERNMIEGTSTMFGYDVGVDVPIGAADIRGSVAHRDVPGSAQSAATLYALAYFYSLSKRTTVYTQLGYLKNGLKTNFGIWPASQSAGSLPFGDAVYAVQIGIRHLF
ncbi:gram-negative porin family protein [Paraburkholderia xenovorans LB400]|uniref:Outer membrane porin, OmpC family n=1 Tax=Paraburkholderia xenovorans (strain LB400) TaxID=266265 RepID=Q13GS9_PARXL|nr:porin [Paraburkholderia xenovorans]ABE36710.1 outer membrane porin, OmpC family [Paraburkholderia xenovorans LB400]AIP34889.1 gram-negative porin family protein [Paraburkholderia xenovorans LB400]